MMNDHELNLPNNNNGIIQKERNNKKNIKNKNNSNIIIIKIPIKEIIIIKKGYFKH